MTDDMKQGERIAKVLARAGVASRREAERLISIGAVAVNGQVIDSPALNIGPKDRVTVNGRPVPAAEPPRMWLYYKPLGLVTSEHDEKGRETVFESLPEDMPRVVSVGRLDLNSEGLLLLTNDGEIKRRLELPATGWLRKYRVRVNGRPEDAALEPLRQGIEVEGERFQPMQVVLDRQQGANAWLTVGLREGRNREIRRAMEAVGLTVNRLIRLSYGPFRLDGMEPGEVREVKARVLRDQLGLKEEGPAVTIARAAPAPKVVGRPSRPPRVRAADLSGAADPSTSLRRAAPAGDEARPLRPKSGPRPGPRPDPGGDDAAAPRAAGRGPRSAALSRPPRAEGTRSHRSEAGSDRPARSFKPRPLTEEGREERPARGPRPAAGGAHARAHREERAGAAPRGERRPSRAEAGGESRPPRPPAKGGFGRPARGDDERPARSFDGRRAEGGDPGKPARPGPGVKPRSGPGAKPRAATGEGPAGRGGGDKDGRPVRRAGADGPRTFGKPPGDRPRERPSSDGSARGPRAEGPRAAAGKGSFKGAGGADPARRDGPRPGGPFKGDASGSGAKAPFKGARSPGGKGQGGRGPGGKGQGGKGPGGRGPGR